MRGIEDSSSSIETHNKHNTSDASRTTDVWATMATATYTVKGFA